jgi:hypothetical protein
MKNGVPAPRELSGVAIHAAYAPELSAIPVMNGVIWCHVV